MGQLIIYIISEIGQFLINEKDFEDFDREGRVKAFDQLKKDFIEELNIFFKTEVKVYEDKEKSLHVQVPFLGSARIDWLELSDPFVIKGCVSQSVDIEHKFESDKKIRLILAEIIRKYPQRYELAVIKPKN